MAPLVLEKRARLIAKAEKIYQKILPCSGKNSFRECFTTFDNKLCFWFNTGDNNTHMLTSELK